VTNYKSPSIVSKSSTTSHYFETPLHPTPTETINYPTETVSSAVKGASSSSVVSISHSSSSPPASVYRKPSPLFEPPSHLSTPYSPSLIPDPVMVDSFFDQNVTTMEPYSNVEIDSYHPILEQSRLAIIDPITQQPILDGRQIYMPYFS